MDPPEKKDESSFKEKKEDNEGGEEEEDQKVARPADDDGNEEETNDRALDTLSPSSPDVQEAGSDEESLSSSIPSGSVQQPQPPSKATTPTTSTTSATTTTTTTTTKKCEGCHKRMSREGCTLSRCLQCCNDVSCLAHKKSKEQAEFRTQILDGTTHLQRTAQQIRSSILPKGRFKERGFAYLGDTITIWNLRQFASGHPKAKEDAIRKSLKRRRERQETNSAAAAANNNNNSVGGDNKARRTMSSSLSRQERFRRVLEQSLQRMGTSVLPAQEEQDKKVAG